MSQFENVSVIKAANVYFDGKCVSHTVQFADGTKKTVGVILPSSLTFNTGAPEIMEGVYGACRAIMQLPEGKRPVTIAFDSVPSTVEIVEAFTTCTRSPGT